MTEDVKDPITLQEAASLILDKVHEQAEDIGLWCVAETSAESYIQQALRELHEVVERSLEGLIEG